MNFTELKANLKNEVAQCYLLYGEDSFLINKATSLIKEAAGGNDVVCFCEDATCAQVTTAYSTISMFGDKRVAVVRNASESMRKELKKAIAVNCNPLEPAIIVKLIERDVAAVGKKITPSAAVLVARYCQNNYSAVDNELKKLINYFWDKSILDVAEVNEIVTKTTEYQLWELGNAICRKDLKLAQEMLQNLRGAHDDYAIFGNLVSTFRRVYFSLKTNAEAAKVAALFKCNPFAITATRRDHKALSSRISELYKNVLDLEYKIKAGLISIESAINIILISA